MTAHSTILIKARGGVIKEMVAPIAKALKMRGALEDMAGATLVGAPRVVVFGETLDLALEIAPCVADLRELSHQYEALQAAFEEARKAGGETALSAARAIVLLRSPRDAVREAAAEVNRRRRMPTR